VDQFPQHPFIGAETIGGVKTAKSASAQGAAAFGIERKRILKRRPATDTEEFGAQWLGRFQTSPADRDARDFAQSLAANAALVGKEKGKKGVEDCPYR